MNTDRFDHLPHVEATLNYLAPMAERPRNYTFDPPPGVPRSNSQREAHTVAIHDVRPVVVGHLARPRGLRGTELRERGPATSGTRTRCGGSTIPRCSA